MLLCAASWGQPASYPEKVVTVVIGFPAGSSTDVLGRALAKRMGELAGQQFIVENKPGAGSNIAAEAVARAPADGHTLLLGGVTNAVNVSLLKNRAVDVLTDLKPVSLVATIPNILIVHPGLGAQSVRELIALARSRPGQIAYGSAGNGTSPHLSGELFNLLAGVQLLHVPYKGSNQAVIDLISGRIAVMFSPASTALPQIQAGKVRALAVTTKERVSLTPGLPTIAEAGLPGYDTSIWFGLLAPATTPRAVIERIDALVQNSLASEDVRRQLAAQGIEPLRGGPAVFDAFLREEVKKWAGVVKSAGIKVD